MVDGKSVKEDYKYREIIGYMPQIGRYPENMTIEETIKMIKETRKNSEEDWDTELLEAFDLKSIYKKKTHVIGSQYIVILYICLIKKIAFKLFGGLKGLFFVLTIAIF